jgi:hypothetical protein
LNPLPIDIQGVNSWDTHQFTLSEFFFFFKKKKKKKKELFAQEQEERENLN